MNEAYYSTCYIYYVYIRNQRNCKRWLIAATRVSFVVRLRSIETVLTRFDIGGLHILKIYINTFSDTTNTHFTQSRGNGDG